MTLFKNHFCLLVFFVIVVIFYYPFLFLGKMPIPADTIVGMYHPFRDVVWDNYVSGVPYKNFLITDPVRQQYLWKKLAVEEMKKGTLPLWNPYSFSGTPLLANFQSSVFYPLNILYFILPFNLAWSLLIFISTVLAGLFLYLYLRNLKLHPVSALFGSLTFSFSGFSIAWLEWNTILHVAAWTILVLLSIDKIIFSYQRPTTNDQRPILWYLIFLFSLVSAFFAGHLQIFFYGLLLIIAYLFFRLHSLKGDNIKIFLFFVFCFLLFVIITSVQWLPTLKFINLSNRQFDHTGYSQEGFFLPLLNLVQFLAPDFFGNPVTGNYFGVWNYAEFVGYLGILGLIFTIFSLFFIRQNSILFYLLVLLFSLSLALPTPLAKLPYLINLPFLSTSQPTRFLFLSVLSAALLSSFGFDKILLIYQNINKNRPLFNKLFVVLNLLAAVYIVLWFIVLFPKIIYQDLLGVNSLVSLRNLILPSIFLVSFYLLFIFSLRIKKKFLKIMLSVILLLQVTDLLRFSWKFIPFTDSGWLYPSTKILNTIAQDRDLFRIMALDRRILPPNFSIAYKFQDISGYDPLYLKNYAGLVSSWENSKPDFAPSSFNRIVTPQKIDSFMPDLLNVKYVLSFVSLNLPKLTLISREGETYLYQNNRFFPRAFLVREVIQVLNDRQEMEMMFSLEDNLKTVAVSQRNIPVENRPITPNESVVIKDYQPNLLVIETKTDIDRLLVVSDMYYPSWRAQVNGVNTPVFRVDYALRGILVPSGISRIVMSIAL